MSCQENKGIRNIKQARLFYSSRDWRKVVSTTIIFLFIRLVVFALILPSQTTPVPLKPSLHSHSNEPIVSVQVAFWWQGLFLHSLTSEIVEEIFFKSGDCNIQLSKLQ